MPLHFVFIVAILAVQLVQGCEFGGLQKWAKDQVQKLGGCDAIAAGSDAQNYKRAPKVKLFLYTNDEWEVLSDFLQYYSYVFSAKNIIVIDQDSQMEEVCKTLALFQECGTTVVTEKGSFMKKDISLTNEMVKYKDTDTFLIPLDTDEFIFSYAEDEPRAEVSRENLWSAFGNLSIDGRKYKFANYMAANPPAEVCKLTETKVREYRRPASNDGVHSMYPAGYRTKTFFHSNGFIHTDAGNHYGSVKHDHGKDNVHPWIQPNLNYYFDILYAPMVHYEVGSYLGSYDKYVRAGIHMGFDGSTNCSAPGRVGGQYCTHVKEYVNGTTHGKTSYTAQCERSSRGKKYTRLTEWFQKHTLSMQKLVG